METRNSSGWLSILALVTSTSQARPFQDKIEPMVLIEIMEVLGLVKAPRYRRAGNAPSCLILAERVTICRTANRETSTLATAVPSLQFPGCKTI
jgi:hypothetical protein